MITGLGAGKTQNRQKQGHERRGDGYGAWLGDAGRSRVEKKASARDLKKRIRQTKQKAAHARCGLCTHTQMVVGKWGNQTEWEEQGCLLGVLGVLLL